MTNIIKCDDEYFYIMTIFKDKNVFEDFSCFRSKSMKYLLQIS